jgi:hypothetical protein
MAAAAEETLRDQCDFLGLTKLLLVQTLSKHLKAKIPKWNAKLERWDLFDDTLTQREAYDRLKAIIEPEEPRPVFGEIKVGVAISSEVSTQEAWLERNKGRVSVTVEAIGTNGSRDLRQSLETGSGTANGSDPGEVGK